ncbi:MAG: hypothetical protein JXR81_10715 [Candidatus Goldbacteria bacterium]|nr:hypothetical protein [Candidatus Goldiibacteriota bacterium]
MADCECLEKCPFFNDKMVNLPATAEIYKKKFCRGDFEGCARYIIFKKLGKEKVPADLLPNQADRAQVIIAQG